MRGPMEPMCVQFALEHESRTFPTSKYFVWIQQKERKTLWFCALM